MNDATAFPVGSVVSIFNGSTFLAAGYVSALVGSNMLSVQPAITTSATTASPGALVLGGATAGIVNAMFTAPAVGVTASVILDSGFGFAKGDYVVIFDNVTGFSGIVTVISSSGLTTTLTVQAEAYFFGTAGTTVQQGAVATHGAATSLMTSSVTIPTRGQSVTVSVASSSPFMVGQYVTVTDAASCFTGNVTGVATNMVTIEAAFSYAAPGATMIGAHGVVLGTNGTVPNYFSHVLPSSDHCNRAVVLDNGGFTQVLGLQSNSSMTDNFVASRSFIGSPVVVSDAAITTSAGPAYELSGGKRLSISGGIVNSVGSDSAGVLCDGCLSATLSGLHVENLDSGIRFTRKHIAACSATVAGFDVDSASSGGVLLDSGAAGALSVVGARFGSSVPKVIVDLSSVSSYTTNSIAIGVSTALVTPTTNIVAGMLLAIDPTGSGAETVLVTSLVSGGFKASFSNTHAPGVAVIGGPPRGSRVAEALAGRPTEPLSTVPALPPTGGITYVNMKLYRVLVAITGSITSIALNGLTTTFMTSVPVLYIPLNTGESIAVGGSGLAWNWMIAD